MAASLNMPQLPSENEKIIENLVKFTDKGTGAVFVVWLVHNIIRRSRCLKGLLPGFAIGVVCFSFIVTYEGRYHKY